MAERSAYLNWQLGVSRWTCQACGELISDRGPSGRSPAKDEQGQAAACQRLAARRRRMARPGD